jgi:type II secretory pathway pseudopilin PulG
MKTRQSSELRRPRLAGTARRPEGRRRGTRAERDQQYGTTLIELTVVMGILLLVVGVMLDALGGAQRSERYAADRTEALDNMRSAIARFTKDVRQADGVDEGATASTFSMDTYVGGVYSHVLYTATGDRLTRSIDGGPAEVLIEQLFTTTVFEFEPSAESAEVVTITLVVEPETSPDTTIELTSEVRMRNRGSS